MLKMTYSLLSDWPDGGESFMAARPDPDLVAEWASRNSKRNARRHPDQPRYIGPTNLLPPKASPEPEPKNVFELARALVAEHAQWGKARDVIKTIEGRVTISPYNGHLQLIYHRSVLKPVIVVDCAIVRPGKDWLWTLTQLEYDEWADQCKSGVPRRRPVYAGGRGLPPDRPQHGKQWRK